MQCRSQERRHTAQTHSAGREDPCKAAYCGCQLSPSLTDKSLRALHCTKEKPWTTQECSLLLEISYQIQAGFSVSTYGFLSHELTPYLPLFPNGTGPGSAFFFMAKQLALVSMLSSHNMMSMLLISPPDRLTAFHSFKLSLTGRLHELQ
ncbi:hypothetical protein SORBI_3007G220150 [Sorghum bicolor]|jgi:hypothetical protein|uniref:Uncharacterized protein n=1 Tax=Sorghum bicolor TaxID=4558 RepID=A0A1Z5RB67_SORBI|nr:hypothetical protein SORBI_3007G220150 [Sorghum bicolor]